MQVNLLCLYQTWLNKVVNTEFFSCEIWSSISKLPLGIIILNVYIYDIIYFFISICNFCVLMLF